MKARIARQIVNSVENGQGKYPLHVLRKAALSVGRPINIGGRRDVRALYFPKGLNGEFVRWSKYRPSYAEGIVAKSPAVSEETGYDYVRELEEKPGTLTVDVGAGMSIVHVSPIIVKMSRFLKAKLDLEFNGVKLVATPVTKDLYAEWKAICDREAEAYRNSPEGIKAKADREMEIYNKQLDVDALEDSIPLLEGTDQWMEWAYQFADKSDDVGVILDHKRIIRKLEAAGWVTNANCLKEKVGKEDSEAESARNQYNKNLKKTLAVDSKAMAEYIMGQVMACLEMNMPPHQVTMHFVEQYRKMVK